MRVPFSSVFTQNPDGSFSPLTVVKIGGAVISPATAFRAGASFGGLDIASIAGHDLEIDKSNDGSVEIKGNY